MGGTAWRWGGAAFVLPVAATAVFVIGNGGVLAFAAAVSGIGAAALWPAGLLSARAACRSGACLFAVAAVAQAFAVFGVSDVRTGRLVEHAPVSGVAGLVALVLAAVVLVVLGTGAAGAFSGRFAVLGVVLGLLCSVGVVRLENVVSQGTPRYELADVDSLTTGGAESGAAVGLTNPAGPEGEVTTSLRVFAEGGGVFLPGTDLVITESYSTVVAYPVRSALVGPQERWHYRAGGDNYAVRGVVVDTIARRVVVLFDSAVAVLDAVTGAPLRVVPLPKPSALGTATDWRVVPVGAHHGKVVATRGAILFATPVSGDVSLAQYVTQFDPARGVFGEFARGRSADCHYRVWEGTTILESGCGQGKLTKLLAGQPTTTEIADPGCADGCVLDVIGEWQGVVVVRERDPRSPTTKAIAVFAGSLAWRRSVLPRDSVSVLPGDPGGRQGAVVITHPEGGSEVLGMATGEVWRSAATLPGDGPRLAVGDDALVRPGQWYRVVSVPRRENGRVIGEEGQVVLVDPASFAVRPLVADGGGGGGPADQDLRLLDAGDGRLLVTGRVGLQVFSPRS